MSVVSIRLNKEEEKILNNLSDELHELHEDKSSIIKHSLKELYEDLIDRKEINKFEQKEKKGKIEFISAEEILKQI